MNFEEELQKLKDAMTVEMVLSERYRTRQQQHHAWIEANERPLPNIGKYSHSTTR